MLQQFDAHWQAPTLIAIVVLSLIWHFLRLRKAKRRERHRALDALDEGVAPAARNQAYIDAPSYASLAKGEKEPEA
jgi:hypothetical protein